MDDRELSFSKSEDEQSEMSNHDFEQDIKPVIKHSPLPIRSQRTVRASDWTFRKGLFPVIIIIEGSVRVTTIVCGSHYR